MNRKLVLALAVSGALAGLAGGSNAQEAPKPGTEKPELQGMLHTVAAIRPADDGAEGAFPEGTRANPELTARRGDAFPEGSEQTSTELVAGRGDAFPEGSEQTSAELTAQRGDAFPEGTEQTSTELIG